MSEATETLTAVKAAYRKALSGQTVQFGDRQYTSQNLDELLNHIKFWQSEVDAETARSSGSASRKPIQMIPR